MKSIHGTKADSSRHHELSLRRRSSAQFVARLPPLRPRSLTSNWMPTLLFRRKFHFHKHAMCRQRAIAIIRIAKQPTFYLGPLRSHVTKLNPKRSAMTTPDKVMPSPESHASIKDSTETGLYWLPDYYANISVGNKHDQPSFLRAGGILHKHELEPHYQDFLRTMRHELLTPLSAVVGMLDLLNAKVQLDTSSHLCLKYAQEASRLLVDQIVAILEFVGIDAQPPVLTFKQHSVIQVLEEASNMWRRRAEAKGLKFDLFIQPCVSDMLRFDPKILRRILDVLLSNAIKFTDQGEVTISLGQGPRIWIKDTGIGVPRTLHDKIFLPFKQADNSTTRKFAGMGLGLAIVHRLASAMGLVLSVDSAPGNGSVFTIHFPLLSEGHPVSPADSAQ